MSTILPCIRTELLFKHHSTHYSIDASEATRGGTHPLFGQAYNDSADEGLVLVSHKTGNTLKMVVNHTYKNDDNDITAWELRSCRTDMRRLKLTETIILTIWNT